MEPQITVNGQLRHAGAAGPHTNLLTWLREQGLTGAKEGCAEGECGACAVMVARPDPGSDTELPDDGGTGAASRTGAASSTPTDGGTHPAQGGSGVRTAPRGGTRWTAINACLVPALAFDGQEIITAEGLGNAGAPGRQANLHPVQQEMVARGGSQCGYCTPGFICSMAAEYYRPGRTATIPGSPVPGTGTDPGSPASDTDAGPNGFDLHALSGNLCRCTGYRPIRDAAYALGTPDAQDPLARRLQEPAPALRHTQVQHGGARFIRPAGMTELLDLYTAEPDAVLLAGATDLGVDVNLRHARPPLVLAVDHLPELRTLHIGAEHIEIGGALTLSELERALGQQVPLLAELFPQFASPLIRNTATLGGNLATASPIGDAAPVLLALAATVVLTSSEGEREVPLSQYFTGYRQTIRTPGEVIRAFRIPTPLAPLSAFHKVAKRRFDDISSVAVAIAMRLEGEQQTADASSHQRPRPDDEPADAPTVTHVRIGLGGVAATPIRAGATEEALLGRPWTAETARTAAAVMAGEGTPMDDHRASARYRAAMLEQSLLRFFTRTHQGGLR